MRLALLLVPGALLSHAQSFDLKLSEDHVQKIEKFKSPAKKLKKYLKYYHKDSIRFIKNWDKRLRNKSDSILASTRTSIQREREKLNNKLTGIQKKVNSMDELVLAQSFNPEPFKNEVEKFYPGHFEKRRDLMRWYLSSGYYKPDSTGINLMGFSALKQKDLLKQQTIPQIKGINGLPNVDGNLKAMEGKLKGQSLSQFNGIKEIKEARQLKGEAGKYSKELSQYRKQYGKYAHTDSLGSLVKQGSSVAEKEMESRMRGMSSMKEFERYQKELSHLQGMRQQYAGEVSHLNDRAYLKNQGKERATLMATNFLKEHQEIMKSVQKKMNGLMKKYSIVPNSTDLSTAVKKTSLKGKTFKERLVVASNFQMISIAPVAIDFAPLLGYKINRNFAVGIGGLYRQTFKDSIPRLSPQVVGVKIFTSYDVAKGFFAYAEFANNSPGVKAEEHQKIRIWKNAMIAGIGRKFLIHKKLEMTTLVAYNFLHKPYDPIYPQPLIVRVGFQLSEVAMLNKRLKLPKF